MEQNKYIAIEGPIGVGKTSLANILSNHFNSKLIREDVNNNPFLENFYTDKKRFAFQTQISFLLNRFKQQSKLLESEFFNNYLVSDYLFAKDKIFAYLNLEDAELKLYEEIYSILKIKLPKPDLVIYLQADPKILKERIEKRCRHFEKKISYTYLESLTSAFNDFFFHYSESSVLIINTTEIDFIKSEEDIKDLIKKITFLKKGKEYYTPLGSK